MINRVLSRAGSAAPPSHDRSTPTEDKNLLPKMLNRGLQVEDYGWDCPRLLI